MSGSSSGAGPSSAFGPFTWSWGSPRESRTWLTAPRSSWGKDPFVMYLGDSLLKNGISAIHKMMVNEKADCVISLMPVVEPRRNGIAKLPEYDKKVLRCVEKPKEPNSNLAVIGVCALNSSFLEVYPKLKPSWRNEIEIADAIYLLIDAGYKVVQHHAEGWWKDIGKLECGSEMRVVRLLMAIEISAIAKSTGVSGIERSDCREDSVTTFPFSQFCSKSLIALLWQSRRCLHPGPMSLSLPFLGERIQLAVEVYSNRQSYCELRFA